LLLADIQRRGINLGTPRMFAYDYEYDTLLNECDPNWYDANKHNELVKYYTELRDMKLER